MSVVKSEMTTETLITIGVSVVTSAITAFAIVAFRMGRYAEKIEQLEKCNFQQRVSTLEGQYSVGNLTKRDSPVALTDKGSKLLNDSGARLFVDNNQNELVKKIRDRGASTAYDVQEKAKEVIESYRDDARFVPMKEFAFKEGIDLSYVELVAGLYLRDKALPEFGFTPEQIDSTDPAKVSSHGGSAKA